MTTFLADTESSLCATYDNVVRELSIFNSQLGSIRNDINQTNATNRHQAQVFLSVATEDYGLQANAFTARPSITNVKALSVALEAEQTSLFKRMVAAIAKFLRELWESVIARLSGRKTTINQTSSLIEKVVATAEVASELPESKTDTPEIETKFEAVLNNYTQLTKLALLNPGFSNGFKDLISKLPANFEFLELVIADYGQHVRTPLESVEQNYVDSQSLAMIRRSVVPAVTTINRLLHLPGLGFNGQAIKPSEDPLRPDELVLVETVSQNATDFRNMLGSLHDESGTITSKSEIQKMIDQIDRLSLLVAAYRETLDKSSALSLKVLQSAKGFEKVAGLNVENEQSNKFDEVRLQAEFIKYSSRMFAQLERAGDLMLADIKAFLHSVAVYQTQKLNDAMTGGDPVQMSALKRKLTAKLTEISDKYE